MDYIYAVLLLHKANKEINEANIKSVLTSAGVSADDAKIKGLVATLKDINIEDAIAKASVVAAAPAATAASETKKEVKEEQVVTEESAAEGLSALFG
ncbi:MAG TPA: 50S ribosomal protein P1 [Candidatus Diapherotrites archaeon]|nr:50S ribosomal protein P1 [Candidatus Diapherotrites archaeon]